jgi:hypothetical protein
MVDGRVVLCHIIPEVCGPWLPVVVKLFLCHAATEIAELHVNRF